ncbi:hypothetical protein [Micromonospora arida]|uniref:hypothetical protein n=1 Tax=Micromonospora arida TaxID=2203715 RepID=UPI000F5F4335|nr:hypothetical protein [Micromonospora arida]
MADSAQRQRLKKERAGAITQVLSGTIAGRWHPTGFAVFHLGDLGAEQKLRLHIWLAGHRPTLANHPHIHSHHWELDSLVLAGTYTDILFQIDTENGMPYFLHEYADGHSVTPRGVVKLRQVAHRTVHTGKFHHIPIGVLHETRVPADASVATLVIMGKPQQVDMMLAGGTRFKVDHHIRPTLTAGEMEQARYTLAAAMD